ncbi:MAG: SDR family NAD(P)-dependent oxidoreductase, partial [Eudoraea sp.]|nr:SDR family NAD(P)-dependent oxidoreductase [Eudoraea sp.]
FDITTASDVDRVTTHISEWGQVDVLINNAGLLLNKPFLESTKKEFEQVYAVNVFGVAELIKAVLPFMGQTGHVVNISSMGGVQGSAKFPGLSAYSSSKGALITLTELLAEEFKDKGPSFNVLALGAVQTEMLEEAFPGYQAPLSAGKMAAYIQWFALEGHRYYNGKVLPVSKSTP